MEAGGAAAAVETIELPPVEQAEHLGFVDCSGQGLRRQRLGEGHEGEGDGGDRYAADGRAVAGVEVAGAVDRDAGGPRREEPGRMWTGPEVDFRNPQRLAAL